MGQFAWVTLATNDSYALGSLVLANSLKKVNTQHQLAVLVTPGVTASMRDKLHATFNLVENVNVLDSKDAAHLALLQRPELGVTFTKLHCWRLTQFEKCVFLDADTYVLQNCDELFQREELSAAPDVGWPDCFNSGVFVYRPNTQTFEKLMQFAVAKGSFDGGDQGLLNSFFSEWAKGDNSKRLPFIYNTCSTACYSYLPAFKQFGSDVKILHFIGQLKPWLISFDPLTRKASPPQEYQHLTEYLNLWWTTFCNEVHPKLTIEMGGLAGALANLKLGSARTPEQEAYEDSCRRNYWEHGSIDYLGTTNTLIQQRVITEVINGRKVEKKIISYPGEQNEEIEEWETTQVGDKTTETHSKKPGQRSIVPLPQQTKQPSPAAEAALKALVNTEVIIVPGHTKVEYDAATNTKTVTEKTTTGRQVTITTVDASGKMKIQTKTYYDPIAIPCDEEEEEEEETYEETYEEEEPTKTTRKTTTDNQSQKQVTQKQTNQNQTTQNQTTQNQTAVDKQQQNVKNTNVSTVDQTRQTSNVTQQQVTQQQQRVSTETTRTTQTQQTQRQVQTSVQNQTQRNNQLVQQNVDQTDLQVAVHEPRHTVVKKKMETGEEVEVHTTISADGRTKTRRRVVTKPAEELEITEIEQTSTYEPGEVKFTTTSKSFPTQTTETRQITQTSTKDTKTTQQQQQQQQQLLQKQQQLQQQQNRTQTNKQTDTQVQKQTKNQNTNVAEQTDKNKSLNDYLSAHHEVRRTSVTETTTMIVQGQTETSTKQQSKQTITKDENVSLSQHGVNVSNTKNQQQTVTSQHQSVDQNKNKNQQYLQNVSNNQQTNVRNQQHESIDQSTTQQHQHTQNVTKNQQTTQQKLTEQQRQQQQIEQQTRTTQQQQLTQQQLRQQQQIEEQFRTTQQQQNKNVDKRFTAHQNETIRTEKHVIKSGEQTTITTTSGHVVTRPETLPGEETTEEVRYFPGGVEYIWKTVRKDGSSKMSSRTFYDPVPVSPGELEAN